MDVLEKIRGNRAPEKILKHLKIYTTFWGYSRYYGCMTKVSTQRLMSRAFAQIMETNPFTIRAPVPDVDMDEVIRASMDPERKRDRFLPRGSSVVQQEFFIDDDEIQAVIIRPEEFNLVSQGGAGIFFGRTPYMRAMVRQVDRRGSMAACYAMMCLDHRIIPDWEWVMECDESNDEDLMDELFYRGLASDLYRLSEHHLAKGEQMERLLTMYHAGIVGVDPPLMPATGFGGHAVALDYFALHADFAIVREPYHGWCLAMSASSLLNLHPYSFLGIEKGQR